MEHLFASMAGSSIALGNSSTTVVLQLTPEKLSTNNTTGKIQIY
jgi:hypothetical protein